MEDKEKQEWLSKLKDFTNAKSYYRKNLRLELTKVRKAIEECSQHGEMNDLLMAETSILDELSEF